ncbi:MAG: hypothetical protein JNN32_06910 [Flavobacteriales bacterium]|nr:hypothetical protein [Flavobacteriales bacterium]
MRCTLVLLVGFWSTWVVGQKVRGYPDGSKWSLDLKTMAIEPADTQYLSPNKRNLPFDVPFSLQIDNAPDLRCLTMRVRKMTKQDYAYSKVADPLNMKCCKPDCQLACKDCDSSNCMLVWTYKPAIPGETPHVEVPQLEPNARYRFCFTLGKAFPIRERDSMILELRTRLPRYLANNLASLATTKDADELQKRIKTILGDEFSRFDEEVRATAKRKDPNATVTGSTAIVEGLDKAMTIPSKDLFEKYLEIENAGVADLRNLDDSEFSAWIAMADSLSAAVRASEIVEGSIRFDGSNGLSAWQANATSFTSIDTRVLNLKENLNVLVGAMKRWRKEDEIRKEELRVAKAAEKKNSKRISALERRRTELDVVLKVAGLVAAKMRENAQMFGDLGASILVMQKEVLAAVIKLDLQVSSEIAMSANTNGTFLTRAEWYLAPDVGLAVPFGRYVPSSFMTFYGVQFHPVPINREVPYSIFRSNRKLFATRSGFATALSINLGITANNFTEEKPEFKGVIGNRIGMVTGMGMRLDNMLRFNIGAVWTRMEDPHPLRTDLNVQANIFVGLSIDIDLKGYITDLSAARAARIITED